VIVLSCESRVPSRERKNFHHGDTEAQRRVGSSDARVLAYLALAKLLSATDAKSCRKEKINHRGHGGELRTRHFNPQVLLPAGRSRSYFAHRSVRATEERRVRSRQLENPHPTQRTRRMGTRKGRKEKPLRTQRKD
jgi:hypothetical protein